MIYTSPYKYYLLYRNIIYTHTHIYRIKIAALRDGAALSPPAGKHPVPGAAPPAKQNDENLGFLLVFSRNLKACTWWHSPTGSAAPSVPPRLAPAQQGRPREVAKSLKIFNSRHGEVLHKVWRSRNPSRRLKRGPPGGRGGPGARSSGWKTWPGGDARGLRGGGADTRQPQRPKQKKIPWPKGTAPKMRGGARLRVPDGARS